MKAETWKLLDELFAETPILRAEHVDQDEIEMAENDLGVRLDNDYKEFIARYGGAIVGPYRVFGLRRAAPMSKPESSFVAITRNFRRQVWPGVSDWVVFSSDHAGNPVGLSVTGEVWVSDHDSRAIQLIAPSFESYIRIVCLNLPN
jgi:hypothetical protein